MPNNRKFKIDIHVHSKNSGDSSIDLDLIPKILNKKGLDGIAITDHDLLTKDNFKGKIIIPGIELSTKDGHLLALGIKTDIKAGLSMNETIKEIHDQSGVAIIAHPYSFPEKCNFKNLNSRPEAIEVLNSRTLFCNISTFLAKRMAKKLSIPMAGGSDSHIPDTIGDAYTIVEAKSDSIDDILFAFKRGRIMPSGKCSSIKKRVKSRIHSFLNKYYF